MSELLQLAPHNPTWWCTQVAIRSCLSIYGINRLPMSLLCNLMRNCLQLKKSRRNRCHVKSRTVILLRAQCPRGALTHSFVTKFGCTVKALSACFLPGRRLKSQFFNGAWDRTGIETSTGFCILWHMHVCRTDMNFEAWKAICLD